MIKVLVVDDHDLVRCGIIRVLRDVDGITVIGEAATGERAIQLAKDLMPDIVLMDINMPGIGGMEATKKIVRSFLNVQVIAVTALVDDPFPTRLMQAGASGYVTKSATLDEVVYAIQTVYAGQRYITPAIAQQMALKSFSRRCRADNPFDVLSERELQISMMVVNCHKVQAISAKLCLSPKTVNSYRYRVFEKLNINSDVELALMAVKHGMLDSAVQVL